MMRRLALAVIAAGAVTGLIATPASASSTFSVVQPHQRYAGKTYGQWSAAWWQWAVSAPDPDSPLNDPTGENCAVNQSGPVWFLAGTPGTSSPSCTVPAGKAILFPVITAECSSVEKNGTTEAELRACAANYINHATALHASVDGTPIDLGPAGSRFRFQSPFFRICFVPDNPIYPDGGKGRSVSDGVWVLLRPLPPGQHEINFTGTISIPEATPPVNFQISVNYHVTVADQSSDYEEPEIPAYWRW
ncbi:hypothetical protein [Frankia sp. CIT1]|uniref:hypothetical protein n=1 Tax=Frankia sp. CIT1 TaxID=2880974 RepID=UPI001EF72195|nr:hypothetical protein [Frankia sp. CIT1]